MYAGRDGMLRLLLVYAACFQLPPGERIFLRCLGCWSLFNCCLIKSGPVLSAQPMSAGCKAVPAIARIPPGRSLHIEPTPCNVTWNDGTQVLVYGGVTDYCLTIGQRLKFRVRKYDRPYRV